MLPPKSFLGEPSSHFQASPEAGRQPLPPAWSQPYMLPGQPLTPRSLHPCPLHSSSLGPSSFKMSGHVWPHVPLPGDPSVLPDRPARLPAPNPLWPPHSVILQKSPAEHLTPSSEHSPCVAPPARQLHWLPSPSLSRCFSSSDTAVGPPHLLELLDSALRLFQPTIPSSPEIPPPVCDTSYLGAGAGTDWALHRTL